MHQDQTCTVTPSSDPLAENVCQGLRSGLGDGCKRLLSVPLKSGISVVGGYSVTPANFSPLVKKKIGEAYGACDQFWRGELTFPEYREVLATKASVLNELFKEVNLTTEADRINDSITAAGADVNSMNVPKLAEKDLEKECGKRSSESDEPCLATPPSNPAPPAPPSPGEIKDLAAQMAKLTAEVGIISTNVARLTPNPDPSLHAAWTLVMQVNFKTGSHHLVRADCERLLAKIAKSNPAARRILIHGSADERGDEMSNDSLSIRRAAATATCLSLSKTGAPMMIQLIGTGGIPTPSSDYAQARAATIFIAP